jgi:signal transduction histidine kinase
VLTDPVSLRQILINLVANAIKFTEAGQVELYTKFFEAGAESRIEIEVRDTGIGISPEQRERLFRPFAQGNASVTRRYGGTGLGLAISQRLAHLLGGRVEVEERAGSRLDLPAGATDGAARRTPPSSRIGASSSSSSAKNPWSPCRRRSTPAACCSPKTGATIAS